MVFVEGGSLIPVTKSLALVSSILKLPKGLSTKLSSASLTISPNKSRVKLGSKLPLVLLAPAPAPAPPQLQLHLRLPPTLNPNAALQRNLSSHPHHLQSVHPSLPEPTHLLHLPHVVHAPHYVPKC